MLGTISRQGLSVLERVAGIDSCKSAIQVGRQIASQAGGQRAIQIRSISTDGRLEQQSAQLAQKDETRDEVKPKRRKHKDVQHEREKDLSVDAMLRPDSVTA